MELLLHRPLEVEEVVAVAVAVAGEEVVVVLQLMAVVDCMELE